MYQDVDIDRLKLIGYKSYVEEIMRRVKFKDKPSINFVPAILKYKNESGIKVNINGIVIGPSGKILHGKLSKNCNSLVHKIEYKFKDKIYSESIARIIWRTFKHEIPDNVFILPKRQLTDGLYSLNNLRLVTPSDRQKELKLKQNPIKNKNSFLYGKSVDEINSIKFFILESGLSLKQLSEHYKLHVSTISKLKQFFKNN